MPSLTSKITVCLCCKWHCFKESGCLLIIKSKLRIELGSIRWSLRVNGTLKSQALQI